MCSTPPRKERLRRVQARNVERGETFAMEVSDEVFAMASDMWEPVDGVEIAGRNIVFGLRVSPRLCRGEGWGLRAPRPTDGITWGLRAPRPPRDISGRRGRQAGPGAGRTQKARRDRSDGPLLIFSPGYAGRYAY